MKILHTQDELFLTDDFKKTFSPRIERVQSKSADYFELSYLSGGGETIWSTVEPLNSERVKCVHGNTVVHADTAAQGLVEADGLYYSSILSAPSRILTLLTADCLAVSFSLKDDKMKAGALVHAGWRGFSKAIHLLALDKLKSEWTTLGQNKFFELLHVTISPSIFGQDYPCGLEVREALRAHLEVSGLSGSPLMGLWDQSMGLVVNEEKIYPDLAMMMCCELAAKGILPKNITLIRDNTFAHPLLPSYRYAKGHGLPEKRRFYTSLVV